MRRVRIAEIDVDRRLRSKDCPRIDDVAEQPGPTVAPGLCHALTEPVLSPDQEIAAARSLCRELEQSRASLMALEKGLEGETERSISRKLPLPDLLAPGEAPAKGALP